MYTENRHTIRGRQMMDGEKEREEERGRKEGGKREEVKLIDPSNCLGYALPEA